MKRSHSDAPAEAPTQPRVRLDKWLWAARFYRTRSLATQAIDAGHVAVDGERAKPSHAVRAGSRISVRRRELTWEVEVLDASDRRGPATTAVELYRETPESIARREQALTSRKGAGKSITPGRPTKRDRRRLEDFLNEP
jgi:ribosome-associated heat shock protein Hsp15